MPQFFTPRMHDLGGFTVGRVLPQCEMPQRRPLRVLRPHRPGDARRRATDRRAPASAHRPGHRHLPVGRRDDASRQPGLGAGNPARRRQLDDRRPRHRPFRTHAGTPARRRSSIPRAADLGCPAAGTRRRRTIVRPPPEGDAAGDCECRRRTDRRGRPRLRLALAGAGHERTPCTCRSTWRRERRCGFPPSMPNARSIRSAANCNSMASRCR